MDLIHRNVEFHGKYFNIVYDNTTNIEYIELVNILDYLGINPTNEYARAKTKFNSIRLTTKDEDCNSKFATVIEVAKLEDYLDSFLNRTKNFKPPFQFNDKLTELIGSLHEKIQKTSMVSPESGESVDKSENTKIHDDYDIENENQMKYPGNEIQKEQEIINNFKKKFNDHEEDQCATEDVASDNDNGSYTATAFVVDRKITRVVNNVIEANELLITMLEDLNSTLKELRDSQFILLNNKE